jgi:hypothetical protein
VLYIWLEKHLSRGDYHRSSQPLPVMNVRPEVYHA